MSVPTFQVQQAKDEGEEEKTDTRQSDAAEEPDGGEEEEWTKPFERSPAGKKTTSASETFPVHPTSDFRLNRDLIDAKISKSSVALAFCSLGSIPHTVLRIRCAMSAMSGADFGHGGCQVGLVLQCSAMSWS